MHYYVIVTIKQQLLRTLWADPPSPLVRTYLMDSPLLYKLILEFSSGSLIERVRYNQQCKNLAYPSLLGIALRAGFSSSIFCEKSVKKRRTRCKVSHADINLKLPKGGKDFYQNTTIREDAPWGLQQVQDAANHLRMAMQVCTSSIWRR